MVRLVEGLGVEEMGSMVGFCFGAGRRFLQIGSGLWFCWSYKALMEQLEKVGLEVIG